MNETQKTLKEQKSKTLEILYNQIASFDNKASIMVSILGVVFALSFTIIDVINKKANDVKIYIFIIFLMFLVSTILSSLFSILVFIPRKKSRTINDKKSITYYGDIIYLDDKEYDKLAILEENQGASFEQIKQNAYICDKKHKNITISIYMLIPMVIFFLITIILIIVL